MLYGWREVRLPPKHSGSVKTVKVFGRWIIRLEANAISSEEKRGPRSSRTGTYLASAKYSPILRRTS